MGESATLASTRLAISMISFSLSDTVTSTREGIHIGMVHILISHSVLCL